MAQLLSADLVGRSFEPIETSWDSTAVLLYACGVGARPPEEVDFLFEGQGPKVLPTFAVVPGMLAMGSLFAAGIEINPMMILHGEQGIELHREIPPDCKARVTGRISEVWDKEKAAVLGCEGVVEDDDGPLFTTKATLFVRGAGGFGGERGPSNASKNAVPDRAPDHVVEDVTRLEQAAVYRLSGDRNPLHIDPSFATMAGYEVPFLHGLCTYGFVGRAILHTLCGSDPARFRSFDARFADQVYPEDTIVTKLWVIGDGEAIVQAETQKGNVVLSQARATYRS
jgi:acyl dehydratase